MELDQVHAFQQPLAGAPTLAVVGSLDHIDVEGLGRLGRVERLELSELVAY